MLSTLFPTWFAKILMIMHSWLGFGSSVYALRLQSPTPSHDVTIAYYAAGDDFDFIFNNQVRLMGVDLNNLEHPCEEYPRCTFRVTTNSSLISKSDVVIFDALSRSHVNWSDLPTLTAAQTSVLYQREAGPYLPASVQSAMNIHMGTFWSDDIRNPRWGWTKQEIGACMPEFYFTPPAQRTGFAIAITSHCVGARMDFFNQLAQIIPLDIYGECTGRPLAGNEEGSVIPNYKFMVSVENHENCGYVSEKLMRGLRYGVVPVYLGDPCIKDFKSDLTDTKWFIDARDFQSPSELGSHLLRINATEEFDSLLSWREEFAGKASNTKTEICRELQGGGLKFRNAAFCTLCDEALVAQLKQVPHTVRPPPLDASKNLLGSNDVLDR